MAKIGRSLQDLAAEIERRAEASRDFIAPVPKFEVAVVDNAPVIQIQNGTQHVFPINDIAHGQIAEYAGIPAAYYRRMLAEEPQLLVANIARWLKDKPQDRRLVRTLDGRVRAFLSDSYRPLDNDKLAEAILPQLLEMRLLIISCEITERRLYIKAVDTNITADVPTGKHMGDGGHTIFDTCSAGITFSNSEVGMGALQIEAGVFTKACTNLAMFGSNMRKYHTGKRAELSDDVYALLTDETKAATDKAVWMQTRDMVKSAFDRARFDTICKKLGSAALDIVEPEKVPEVIERVGRKLSLNEGERKGILGRLIADGDLTRYGLHSAITRYSQEDVIAYDRATEMERMGGDIIDMPANDWRQLVAA